MFRWFEEQKKERKGADVRSLQRERDERIKSEAFGVRVRLVLGFRLWLALALVTPSHGEDPEIPLYSVKFRSPSAWRGRSPSLTLNRTAESESEKPDCGAESSRAGRMDQCD